MQLVECASSNRSNLAMLRIKSLVLALTLGVVAFSFIDTTRVTSNVVLRRLTITPEQSLNLNPSLSESGSVVAFESTADLAGVGGNSSFHAVRTSLAETISFEDIGRTRAVTPGLSGDGNRLVFASNEDLVGQNADRNSEIYLLAGSHLEQLTHTEPAGAVNRLTDGNYQPSLTTDGRFAVFSSNRNLTNSSAAFNFEVFVADTIDKTFRRLTNDPTVNAFNPKISGDGSRVYFIKVHGD